MTNEDLGPEATEQDRTDLDTLRDHLKWWELTIFSLGHPAKERNMWTQVPPQEQDRNKSQRKHRGRGARQGRTKTVSCFHPNTRVRMLRSDNSGPEYKRLADLIKGDQLWTRRNSEERSSPKRDLFSTVECVMTFTCSPEEQVLVDIEGNLLTPDHYVFRGHGQWTTARELLSLGGKSSTQSSLLVYNIMLQDGEHIELDNGILKATLGARFDRTSQQKEPTYPEQEARNLRDLPGYPSGHIHWALGTALVDCHGMPTPSKSNESPSPVGTATLLDEDTLEVNLDTQRIDQKWIDIPNRLRRVHSIWNHAAQAIFPELTTNIFGIQSLEEEKSWRLAFHRKKLLAEERIGSLRERVRAKIRMRTPQVSSPQGHPNTGQTCLSGCALLANPSGGIQMREVHPGTFIINAKGKKVTVTNVYFSRESTVMVQISAHCHATITHPMLDTKKHGRTKHNRSHSTKTIITAAEWHTRRRNDTYRFTPMGSPLDQPL